LTSRDKVCKFNSTKKPLNMKSLKPRVFFLTLLSIASSAAIAQKRFVIRDATYTFNFDETNPLIVNPGGRFVQPITLGGPTPVDEMSTDNFYFTEPNMKKYQWVIKGGELLSGGSETENYVQVKWVKAEVHSISITYADPALSQEKPLPATIQISVVRPGDERMPSVLRDLEIYPSPAQDHVNVLNYSHDALVEIIDGFGNVIYPKQGLKGSVNTSNLTDGIYYMKIYQGNSIQTKRITVSRSK
jgi:hypothetical protein